MHRGMAAPRSWQPPYPQFWILLSSWEAVYPLLSGLTVVALDPFLHSLADVPGGMVPDAPESSFALGRNVCGKPGKKGAGDRANGTPVDKTSQYVVGRGHVEPITGNRLALWVLGKHGLFHQADGLVIAPSMQLGLSLATPPDVIFAAQGNVRMVGRDPDQPIAWRFCNVYAGSGLTIQCLARFQLTPKRTMASSIVGKEKGLVLRPGS